MIRTELILRQSCHLHRQRDYPDLRQRCQRPPSQTAVFSSDKSEISMNHHPEQQEIVVYEIPKHLYLAIVHCTEVKSERLNLNEFTDTN